MRDVLGHIKVLSPVYSRRNCGTSNMLSHLGRRSKNVYLACARAARFKPNVRVMTTTAAPAASIKIAEKNEESNDIFYQFVGAAALFFGLYATVDIWGAKPPKKLSEQDCLSKKQADLLPGDVGSNGGSIKRVKQANRLPLEILSQKGIKHGELEGTAWIDESGDFYQQTYWNDEAAYELTSDAAKTMRDASWNLHAMCLEAVDLVVGNVIYSRPSYNIVC